MSYLDTGEVVLLTFVQVPPQQISLRLRPTTIPRTETCRRIFERTIRKHVILARGTPTIGKTTLAKAFTNYINEQYQKGGKYLALFIDASGAHQYGEMKERILPTEEYIHQEYLKNSNLPRDEQDEQDFHYRDDLIIVVDEAQTTYHDNKFWQSLKEQTTRYLLFASYGSPGSYPIEQAVTPWVLDPSQRIGFRHSTDSIKTYLCSSLSQSTEMPLRSGTRI